MAAELAEEGAWTEAAARDSGKTVVVRARPGIHIERVAIFGSESVEAAERETAAAQNGKGSALFWLEPMHGETAGASAEDDSATWETPAPSRGHQRGWLRRLRGWWAGRTRSRLETADVAPSPREENRAT